MYISSFLTPSSLVVKLIILATVLIVGHVTGQFSQDDRENGMIVTSLLIPSSCDQATNLTSSNQSTKENLTNYNGGSISEVISLTNQTIISSAFFSNYYILTNGYLFNVRDGQIIDNITLSETITDIVTSEPVTLFMIKNVSRSQFAVKCHMTWCTFFNLRNLSDFQTIQLSKLKGLSQEFVFDDNNFYLHSPVGQWLRTGSGTIIKCQQVDRYLVALSSDGKSVQMFNSFDGYNDILYHFQFNRSSFLIKHNQATEPSTVRTSGRMTLMEIREDGASNSELRKNYRVWNPVAIYFDPLVSKLHVVFGDSNRGLKVGWISLLDPFVRPLQDVIPLPFDTFKQFVVTERRRIFNLGKEFVIMDGNKSFSLNFTPGFKVNNQFNNSFEGNNNPGLQLVPVSVWDKSMEFEQASKNGLKSKYLDKLINFFLNNQLFKINLPKEDFTRKSKSLIAVYISVTGIFLILAFILISVLLIRKRNETFLVSGGDGKGIADIQNGPEASVPPYTSVPKLANDPSTVLPPGLVHQPIFIFNDALSNIVVLSRGAFGEVCKGIYNDGKCEHEVAIKSLFRFDANKLKAEAEIAASLNHPNVLSLIGICFDTSNQTLKLVLPFMSNGDLASYLDKNQSTLTGSILRSFASQIASGMVYLVSEDRGHPSIIHRDLAARNCMIDGDLVVKVADFGLSRHLDESKQKVKRSLQTSLIPSTSAPESITRLVFNEKSDVWSYGSVLLELYDCDMSTVPEKVLDLSSVCHSIDPDSRPNFAMIESQINKELTANDFEPVTQVVTSGCHNIQSQVAPPVRYEINPNYTYSGEAIPDESRDGVGSGTVSREKPKMSDYKLLEMIQEAPYMGMEIEEQLRKESFDQEPFDDIRSFLVNKRESLSKGKFNGYTNPGGDDLALVELDESSLKSYANIKGTVCESNLEQKEGAKGKSVKFMSDPQTGYVAPPGEALKVMSKDAKVEGNGYLNLGSTN